MKAIQGSPKQVQGQKSYDDGRYDDEFINLMLEVENLYTQMGRHDRIRIEQWTRKLCQVTSNLLWKKNRNLYAKQLLENVKTLKLQPPFNKQPYDGPLIKFNKFDIVSVNLGEKEMNWISNRSSSKDLLNNSAMGKSGVKSVQISNAINDSQNRGSANNSFIERKKASSSHQSPPNTNKSLSKNKMSNNSSNSVININGLLQNNGQLSGGNSAQEQFIYQEGINQNDAPLNSIQKHLTFNEISFNEQQRFQSNIQNVDANAAQFYNFQNAEQSDKANKNFRQNQPLNQVNYNSNNPESIKTHKSKISEIMLNPQNYNEYLHPESNSSLKFKQERQQMKERIQELQNELQASKQQMSNLHLKSQNMETEIENLVTDKKKLEQYLNQACKLLKNQSPNNQVSKFLQEMHLVIDSQPSFIDKTPIHQNQYASQQFDLRQENDQLKAFTGGKDANDTPILQSQAQQNKKSSMQDHESISAFQIQNANTSQQPQETLQSVTCVADNQNDFIRGTVNNSVFHSNNLQDISTSQIEMLPVIQMKNQAKCTNFPVQLNEYRSASPFSNKQNRAQEAEQGGQNFFIRKPNPTPLNNNNSQQQYSTDFIPSEPTPQQALPKNTSQKTLDFLEYLNEFQKKTDKLKQETEKILNDNKIKDQKQDE